MQKVTYSYKENSIGNLFFSKEKTLEEKAEWNFLYEKDNHLGNVHAVVSDRKLMMLSEDINATQSVILSNNFTTGTDGWTGANATLVHTNQRLEVTTTADWGAARKIVNTQPGLKYKFKLKVFEGNTQWISPHVVDGNDVGVLNYMYVYQDGIYELEFTATTSTSILKVASHAGVTFSIDDVEVYFGVAYTADLKSSQDYYVFGMQMPGRTFNSTDYRYGFNGKEKDDEVKGSGNSYDFGARIYDPRIGRFLSIDPLIKSYPWYTPYQFAGNSPISKIDQDGEHETYYLLTINKQTGKTTFRVVKGDGKSDKQYFQIHTIDKDGKSSTVDVAPELFDDKKEHIAKAGQLFDQMGTPIEPSFNSNSEVDKEIAEQYGILDSQKKELKRIEDLEFANDKQKSDNPADPSAGGEGINLGKGVRATQIQAQKEMAVKEVKKTEQKIDSLKQNSITKAKGESVKKKGS